AMARASAELDRNKARLQLRESHLADLGRISRWAASQQKLAETFSQTLKVLVKALQASGAALLMPEPGSQNLRATAIEGLEADPLNQLPCKGFPTLASGLFHRACPSISPDPAGTPNPVDKHLLRWKIVSHIASPVEAEGQTQGLLTAYRAEP